MRKLIVVFFCIASLAARAYDPDCGCFDTWHAFWGQGESKRYVALRTNLLSDAAAVPMLGVELALTPNLTVETQWMWAWWSRNTRYRYWRISAGSVEARWYFRAGAYSGHHAGVYCQMGTYDFEFGNRGVLAPRWSYAAGLAYGYTVVLNRRLSLDFNIGVGWLGGKYDSYRFDCGQYMWQSRHRHHYIGPTRAEVTLSWLLWRPNEHKKSKMHRP